MGYSLKLEKVSPNFNVLLGPQLGGAMLYETDLLGMDLVRVGEGTFAPVLNKERWLKAIAFDKS